MINDKKQENMITRPPVVVVLGHIDHGKTSLLMAIREFNILEKEAGGITQHVGAYEIEHDSHKITFIDTPGHEAFSAIRSRGSKIADIAILVIDACEGIKKQTKEAITHIKNAEGLSLIIALNKIDKPGANPEMVKQQLGKEDIWVESIGGKVPCVEISAKTGLGINDLLDLILLVAEMEELKADINVNASGAIIESYLDHQRGPTATILVEQGILKQGDYISTNTSVGKVKNLEDFLGKEIKEARPSQPGIIVGFESVPVVGEQFTVYSTYDEAKQNVKKKEKREIVEMAPDQKCLNLIIKGDAYGSLEAIEEILKTLPQDKVCLRIVKAEVGDIADQDVKMAKSTEAAIIAFRVKKDKIAEITAENNKTRIYDFELIYDLTQKVRELMERKLTKEKERTDLGKMEVVAIFRTEKNRQIVGGNVIEGEIHKGALIEIFRDNEKIGNGRIVELQSNKKDFDVVKKGKECGILYQGNERIKEGDELVAYKEEYVKEVL